MLCSSGHAVNFIQLKPNNLTKGELKIVNCNGQVVYVESLQLITKESELKINISTFPKGIYFIQLVGDEKVMSCKFIVDR